MNKLIQYNLVLRVAAKIKCWTCSRKSSDCYRAAILDQKTHDLSTNSSWDMLQKGSKYRLEHRRKPRPWSRQSSKDRRRRLNLWRRIHHSSHLMLPGVVSLCPTVKRHLLLRACMVPFPPIALLCPFLLRLPSTTQRLLIRPLTFKRTPLRRGRLCGAFVTCFRSQSSALLDRTSNE